MRTVTRTAPSSCRLKYAHARNEPFLQGKVDHHHGLEKQAIWPLHIHKKVATALQIQQLLKIQNLISSLQLLRDNLTLWTSDTAAEGEEAEAGADN